MDHGMVMRLGATVKCDELCLPNPEYSSEIDVNVIQKISIFLSNLLYFFHSLKVRF